MTEPKYYRLDPSTGSPVPEPDLLTWARWFETADRAVARTAVGPYTVSTVFLGIDHAFGAGPPLLWETMVFGPDDGGRDERRWHSRTEALAGHEAAVAALRLSAEAN
jgi:hypothetical protein